MLIRPKDYFSLTGKGPQKHLGQHFLTQPSTAERIVESLGIGVEDSVVEIGPGLGALTRFLLFHPCRLHLVEIDESMVEMLQQAVPKDAKASILWHRQDFLTVEWNSFICAGKRVKVVGNIPYNISSPILFKLIEGSPYVDRAVLMVQKEVGLRWSADPGNKHYGVPSVMIKGCAKVSKLFDVRAGQFYPPPKVDSLVVLLEFFKVPLWRPLSYGTFHDLVASLFKNRRKTVLNGLKRMIKYRDLPEELIKKCLERLNITSKARPEDITVEQYVGMAKFLSDGWKGAEDGRFEG